MGVDYLPFDILLNAKSEKVIGNTFCTPIIFKNPLKTCFFIKKYTFYNLRRVRFDCNIYFLFEKQAFNGLLKVIGIQNVTLSE